MQMTECFHQPYSGNAVSVWRLIAPALKTLLLDNLFRSEHIQQASARFVLWQVSISSPQSLTCPNKLKLKTSGINTQIHCTCRDSVQTASSTHVSQPWLFNKCALGGVINLSLCERVFEPSTSKIRCSNKQIYLGVGDKNSTTSLVGTRKFSVLMVAQNENANFGCI